MEQVTSKAWSHLMRSYMLMTDELVGIDAHVEQVARLLSSDSDGVKIVGIHGMGGIGKTTITKAVYNELCSRFDRFCFVEDAREMLLKSNGVVKLQSVIISSILRTDYKVKDTSEGLHVIKDRVCKHKVLIVLDDVNDLFEFDKILGKLDCFSPGSRFIVTTRDKRVLQVLQDCKLYEPGEMSNDHALQLFSKHAFGTNDPPKDDANATLSMEFVKVAAGLPLALKVIGSLLFRRENEFWAAKLIELKDIPPTKLQERLKISYNELSHNEKQIFLDIACSFIGVKKNFPSYMWSDCKLYPESGINTLLLRSLVKLNEDNEFWMHDHIRDLGRTIVREEDSQRPWKRSRIWSNEDALEILRSDEGSDLVEVLRVNMKEEDLELTDKEFKKLPGLRYLEVCYGSLIGDLKGVLPNIRWLRLHDCSSIPNDVNMKKLVVLDMQNCPVKDDWRGWGGIKVAHKLKAINLSLCGDLRSAPDLSQCRDLEFIQLFNCSEMSGELHIGKFKNLKLLTFHSTKITKLTGNMVMLKALKHIDAQDLRDFPSDIGRLSSLEILYLPSLNPQLTELAVLPTSLKRLSLSSSRVPNLSELTNLEDLYFKNCPKLQLLGGMWKLSKLKTLKLIDLSCCNSLLDVDMDQEEEGSCTVVFPLPSSLNCLDISGSEPGLEILPNFANLNYLTELTLSRFKVHEIQGLGDLRMLESLLISSAENLTNLDGLETLSHLKTLTLENCSLLEKLPRHLANLTKLHELSIDSCLLLSDIRGLAELRDSSLSDMYICNCPSLDHPSKALDDLSMEPLVPSLCKVATLRSILLYLYFETDHSDRREQFLDVSGLRDIKKVRIIGYNKLSKVYGVDKLNSLASLVLSDCTSIRELPDGLENLENLSIDGCMHLVEIQGLGGHQLKSLDMSGCTSITQFPDHLSRLESLVIDDCTQLSDVTSLYRFEALRSFSMKNCTSVTKLPDLSALMDLSKLQIGGCRGLTELSGIERLESLEQLSMQGCCSVKELPDFSGLENIRCLDISECKLLNEVVGIENLVLLKSLTMRNCTSVKKLSDLSGCKKLYELDITGCVQLDQVCGIDELNQPFLTVRR
ncbi:Disease resistance protein L6 [Linum grandiflorum]